MIANVPYIETSDYSFYPTPVVNEYVISAPNNESDLEEQYFFLNLFKSLSHISSTEEIIDKEQKVGRRIKDITDVCSFLKNNPEIFAFSSEQFVLSTFEKLRSGLMQFCLDFYYIGISLEEECLFVYGQKDSIKLFFNLFFEKNEVETLVNISASTGKYIIEDNIENSIQQLFEIFQAEPFYASLS